METHIYPTVNTQRFPRKINIDKTYHKTNTYHHGNLNLL